MTAHAPDHRERAYAPRGLRREAAADWVGMSPSKFDELVKDGRMPKPKRVDGVVVWDRYRLDAAFEALPDDGGSSAWSRVA
jgi:predicted DNA-binding transcriptional regulator AlpA